MILIGFHFVPSFYVYNKLVTTFNNVKNKEMKQDNNRRHLKGINPDSSRKKWFLLAFTLCHHFLCLQQISYNIQQCKKIRKWNKTITDVIKRVSTLPSFETCDFSWLSLCAITFLYLQQINYNIQQCKKIRKWSKTITDVIKRVSMLTAFETRYSYWFSLCAIIFYVYNKLVKTFNNVRK